MIPYRSKKSLFDNFEPVLLGVLLIIAIIAIACMADASSVVVKKDMNIASLLDVQHPPTLAEK